MKPTLTRRKRLPSLIIGISMIILGFASLFFSVSMGILAAIAWILLAVALLMVGSLILIIRYAMGPIFTPPSEVAEAHHDAPSSPPASTPRPEQSIDTSTHSEVSIDPDRVFQRQEEFDFPGRFYPIEEEASDELAPPTVTPTLVKPPAKRHPTSYIVLDIETTGLSPKVDSIIEFGAIKVEDGKETDSLQTFINPGRPVPQRITEITGITDADLISAPDLLSVIHVIYSFIGDLPVVAHNAFFDLGFLRQAYAKAGLSADFQVIDTLSLSRAVFPNAPNYKLNTLIDYLRLDGEQEHRALSDVRYTNQVYLRCLSAGK